MYNEGTATKIYTYKRFHCKTKTSYLNTIIGLPAELTLKPLNIIFNNLTNIVNSTTTAVLTVELDNRRL